VAQAALPLLLRQGIVPFALVSGAGLCRPLRSTLLASQQTAREVRTAFVVLCIGQVSLLAAVVPAARNRVPGVAVQPDMSGLRGLRPKPFLAWRLNPPDASKGSSMIPTSLPTAPPQQPEPQRDVPPELRPLATYAAHRALHGRPLLEDLGPLRKADDTVRETRAMLWAGRGNVREDLVRTSFDSSRRTFVMRNMVMAEEHALPADITDSAFTNICAGLAAAAGAGNCGEHASIALRLHAGRLGEGQVVSKLAQLAYDHVWVVQSPKAGEHGPTIVIDPWMRGPAVMLEDARPLHRMKKPTPFEIVSAEQAPAVHEAFQTAVARAAAQRPEIEALVAGMESNGCCPQSVCRETDVTSTAFRVGAIAAAAREPGTIHSIHSVSIPTVAAARELGANVKGAAAFAREVIAELDPANAAQTLASQEWHRPLRG
jgi:hypothetical protein